MKKLILSIVVLVMCFAASAKRVSVDDARRVAVNFWNQTTKSECPQLVNVSPIVGLTEQYLFVSVDNDGFVIVAADDIATPILGYSVNNGFAGESMPPHLEEWLMHYDKEIVSARNAGYQGDESSDSEWYRLLNNIEKKGASTKSVTPLVTTQWDQGYPYNTQCPYDNNGHSNVRSVTGCVATAMSQVMKYWNWPLKGNGSHSYTCSTLSPNAPTNELSADFSSTTYNWNLMPAGGGNSASSWAAGQRNAVSTLIYHCGVSVEMKYKHSASSASTSSVPNALKNFFGYSNTATYTYKQSYNEANWLALIEGEIDEGRPVLYRGEGEDGTGGHSFVCDGYDANNKFHFNWGWSGSGDGYYSTSSLTPTSTGTGAGLGNYTYSQGAVIKITPQLQTHNSFTLDEYVASGSNLTGTCGIRNSGVCAFKGYIGVAAYNSTGHLVTILAQSDLITFNGNSSRNITINQTTGSPLVLGTYTAKAVCSMDGSTWHPIMYGYNGCATETTFTVTDGSQPTGEPCLKIFENFSISSSIYSVGDEILGSCGIKNVGTATYSGLLGVAAYNSSNQIVAIMDMDNRTIAAYSMTNIQFNYTIPAGFTNGTYTVKAVSSTDNGTTWQAIDSSNDGTPTQVYFNIGGNSIEDIHQNDVKVNVLGSSIVISDAEGYEVSIVDLMGRTIHKTHCNREHVSLRIDRRGVYLVKIGDMPAKKVYVCK